MTGFAKRYASAADAARALHRSRALAAAGVPTPAARPGGAPAIVVFDRLEGASGAALVSRALPDLLRPLLALHGTPLPGLPTFDPLLRIRPRLAAAPRWVSLAIAGRWPAGGATLHGDFHFGQLVAARRGAVHIVDLDDMALGPPEADLGNLAAHLATSPWAGPDFGIRLAHWQDAVRSAWAGLGGPCDPGRFRRFLDLALVRRHLKLREAGRPDFGAEIAARLSGAEGRISPSGSAACRG